MRKMRISSLALVSGLLFTVGVPALALDTLSPRQAAAATSGDECPALTQIKYPFLACAASASGAKVLTATDVATEVEGRRSPYGLEFPEGPGYWGRSPDTRDGRLTNW